MNTKLQVQPTHPHFVVEGTGGYVYEEWPDGRIRILASPREGAGRFITAQNPFYADVKGELERFKRTGTTELPGVGDFPQAADAARLSHGSKIADQQVRGARQEVELNEAAQRARVAAAQPKDSARGMADSLPTRAEAPEDAPVLSRGPRGYRSEGVLTGLLDDR